jgi:type IV secretory pathway VirB3-like protein
VADAKRDLGEPKELIRSDLHGITVLLVPALIAGAIAALLGLPMTIALFVTLLWGAVLAAVIVVVTWLVGRNAVFADDKGLIVIVRDRATRSYPWTEILDASWYGGSFWTSWDPGAVVVTTTTGAEEKFAPRTVVRVGCVVIVGPKARAEATMRVDAHLEKYLSHGRRSG